MLWHNGIDGVSAAARTQVQCLAWYSGLRIQHCHSCSVGGNSGSDLIPGPGTPYATRWPKKKKEKKKKITHPMEEPRDTFLTTAWKLSETSMDLCRSVPITRIPVVFTSVPWHVGQCLMCKLVAYIDTMEEQLQAESTSGPKPWGWG